MVSKTRQRQLRKSNQNNSFESGIEEFITEPTLNNRTVDIYINGKLERTCILEGIPKNLANDKLTVTYNNGFYGKMGKLQYFTKSLNPEEIAKLYMAGPEGSSGLTGSLFNNGQITNSSS